MKPSKHLDPYYVEKLITMLNKAIADEVLAWYQYSAGAFYAEGLFRAEAEKEFLEHAEDEKNHMYQLMERIQELGGYPISRFENILKLTNCGFTPPTNQKDTLNLILDNVRAEECAIEVYSQIADFALENKDYKTFDIVSKILEEEENHRAELQMFIDDYKKVLARLKMDM